MPYPRFTKIIINHFLKEHKSLTNLNHKHYHTIKDDDIVRRLKFVRIGEDYHKYGHHIHDVMLTDAIKCSKSYQMFIKYSTNQIPPKKSRGKGSKGKKTAEESQETVDVSEESEPEPKPAKKKTSGKRRLKKKITLSADDNIISDDPDAALELAKSISQTEAEEAKAARKVHATHARIMTEFVPEIAKKKSSGRSSKSVVIQDTPNAPKSKPATSKTKLKGAPSLTSQEQEAADIMQALKESKKTSRRQPGVLDEDKDVTEEKVILEWGNEQDSEFSNDDNDDVEKDDKDGDADDKGNDHVSDTQDDEGDFLRLRLQDIEDMLLLLVQQKLTNLMIDEHYDLNVALRMFTRRIVKIMNRTHSHRAYLDPQGMIYEDQNTRNRLMRTDKLHKFSDGTLNSVWTAFHDITLRIRMEYLPKRKWSGLDKRRARVMIKDIDKQLFQRRLMRNLEKFIGGREYGNDLRLLERTI
ncbi:hypothetical protein Tco_1143826 [Tanacetum coccineum]